MTDFKNQRAGKKFYRQFCCFVSLAFPTLLLDTQEKTSSFYIGSKNLEFTPINIDRIYYLLQRKSIRDLAFRIILTIENETLVKDSLSAAPNFYRGKLLKNYLLKYQYNYFRYFIKLYPELDEPITIKELNTQAIEVLYIVYGV